MRFENKVAIVTGGGNGMGRATALRLAREGAAVLVADIEEDNAIAVSRDIIGAGGRALGIGVDVRSGKSVQAMVKRAVSEFEHIDILCAIAGVVYNDLIVDMPEEHWDAILDVNLKGVFLCGQAVARQMIKQAAGGRIVNMSSTNGLVGEAELGHYNASKFGVIGVTMTMAIELGKHNITVNAVCPGFIRTRMTDQYVAIPGFADSYLSKIPLGRFGTVDDVAGAFLFLASDDASFITGTTLVVDGGQLAF